MLSQSTGSSTAPTRSSSLVAMEITSTMTSSLSVEVPSNESPFIKASSVSSSTTTLPSSASSSTSTSSTSGVLHTAPRRLHNQFAALPVSTPTSAQRVFMSPSSQVTSSAKRNLCLAGYTPRSKCPVPPSPSTLTRSGSFISERQLSSRSLNSAMNQTTNQSTVQAVIDAPNHAVHALDHAVHAPNHAVHAVRQAINHAATPIYHPLPLCSPLRAMHQRTVSREQLPCSNFVSHAADVIKPCPDSPYIGKRTHSHTDIVCSPSSSSERSPSPLNTFPPSPLARAQVIRPLPSPNCFSSDEAKPSPRRINTPAPRPRHPDAPFVPNPEPVASSTRTLSRSISLATNSSTLSSPTSPAFHALMASQSAVKPMTDERSAVTKPETLTCPEAQCDAQFPWMKYRPHLIVQEKCARGINRISVDTFRQILAKFRESKTPNQINRPVNYSDFAHHYDSMHVFDCRFSYEYEGGHIEEAVHIDQFEHMAPILWPQGLQSVSQSQYESHDGNPSFPWSPRTLIIFHCEFSQERAPEYYLRLKRLESELFDSLSCRWPEMYMVQGGYSDYVAKFGDTCVPVNGYVSMFDPRHTDAQTRNKDLRRIEKAASRSGTNLKRKREDDSDAYQRITRSMSCGPVVQSVNQSIDQSINQSIDETNEEADDDNDEADDEDAPDGGLSPKADYLYRSCSSFL